VRRALYGAKIVAYAQGFDLIRQASEHYRWQIDLAALALIWRDGCIIRARLLDDVRRAYLEMPEIESLLVDDHFANVLDAADEAWREVVVTATRNRVAAPAFASALNHLDALKAERLPTTVVQAQRDYMGAHLYRRVDRPGVFHTRWNGDHAEVEVG
jgi:6-phosphogluconate dehydrogenase